jgi:hypothetical protein
VGFYFGFVGGISPEIVLIKNEENERKKSESVYFLKFTGNYPYKPKFLSY